MDAAKKKMGVRVITALLAGGILVLAVPLLLGACYTYPSADDFILENGSLYQSGMIGPVKGPLYAAWNYFMDWQGAYTTNLLLFTLIPFSRFGLNGFRVCMALLSLMFVLSLYFMANAVISYSHRAETEYDKNVRLNKKLFLHAVLLFAALGLPGTWIGKGLFYWYTAALGYLVGINCLFLAIGCLLLANRGGKKKGYYICSMLLGFLASGVSPQVASFVCSWMLLVLLVLILSAAPGEKRLHLWDIGPFLTSFVGALINVTAPGSMRRNLSTMGDTHYGVADAVKDTFHVLKETLAGIWHDPLFITLAVLLLLAAVCFGVKAAAAGRPLAWYGVLLVFGGVLVSNFLCIFPVILGYHGGGLSNDRTQYVADFEIRFSLLFAILYLAQYLAQVLSERGKRTRIVAAAGALCGFLVCAGGFLFLNDWKGELLSGYSFELIKELSDGTVREVFALRKEVLEALEAAEDGTDVVLQMPAVPETRVTYPQGITDDAGYLVNVDVANLFHLNSVVVTYGSP